MKCEFKIKGKWAVCTRPDCDIRIPVIDPALPAVCYHAKCKSSATEETQSTEPGLLRRGASFLTAVARWKAAGSPVRSPERIEEILAICQACEHFQRSRCNKCGCAVNKSPNGLRNKIAMATERCPLQPPKWDVELPRAD